MKIFLTGNKGYIGSYLEPLLTRAGHQVVGADLKDGINATKVIHDDIDCVIHAAAFTDVIKSIKNPDDCYKTNVDLTISLIKTYPLAHFIFLSTCAIYQPISIYGESKQLAEKAVKTFAKSYCILRMTNAVDTKNPKEGSVHWHFLNDDPIVVYGGRQTRDFISLETIGKNIIESLNQVGIKDVASGVKTKIIDLANEMATKRNVKVIIKPERPGEIL